MEKAWFEMREATRSRVLNALWTPLYLLEESRSGDFDKIGWQDETYAVRSLAVPLEQRAAAARLTFGDMPHQAGTVAWNNDYRETGRHRIDDQAYGVQLALLQLFDEEPAVLTLHQDLVFALNLMVEGDTWVRPEEAYSEVAKLRRNEAGRAIGLYIRPAFLKDYLAARSMALLVSSYRERRATLADASAFGWTSERAEEERDGGVFSVGTYTRGQEQVAVLKMSRTDAWQADELPVLDTASDETVRSEQRTFTRATQVRVQVDAEFRRIEWIEPAASSPRVRHDDEASALTFITGAAGERTPVAALDHEEIGRWLWFDPAVVPALLSRRGSALGWYTRQTGGVQSQMGYHVHFGINAEGMLVAYAHDIAKLPEWQRQVWAGFNINPGSMAEELRAAQVLAEPAATRSPEDALPQAVGELDAAFTERFGVGLMLKHQDFNRVLQTATRFAAANDAGLLALAKNLARLTADSFDVSAMRILLKVNKAEKPPGSLKSLEKLLATVVPAAKARQLMGVLAGVYALRLGDAHMPPSDIADAYTLAGVPADGPWIHKGETLLFNLVGALTAITDVLRSQPVRSGPAPLV